MSERLEQDLNSDHCDAAVVLWQLRYQANWELVIIWVYGNPVDSEYMQSYYMAKPVLGKSLCSDWFFLGQDFTARTISMETVQSTLKLSEEAKKIEIFPKFQR